MSSVLQSLAATPRVQPLRRLALRGTRVTFATSRPLLHVRNELPHLLNRRGHLGLGFEVGVREGEFSELLLLNWRGEHLVSVDPWAEADPDEYVDLANIPQERQELIYEQARTRLARFGDRSTIWRTTSMEAAKRVLPASADFVYLDARHDYTSVLEDLATWYPRVRPGGLIAGHDYLDGEIEDGAFGVKSAEDQFVAAQGVLVRSTPLELYWPTWVVEVPRHRSRLTR